MELSLFEQAKKLKSDLELAVKQSEEILKTFPDGPMGLTPDHVRALPEWKLAKKNFDVAFGILRNFNQRFVKTFKKELAAERKASRG